jgi:hypothetical protein
MGWLHLVGMNVTASEGAPERGVGIYMTRHDIAAITVAD